MTWKVVPLQPQHLTDVVDVHVRAFPTFFLTFLGRKFLREFYGSFVEDPIGIGFVAEEESGRVRGVVVGPLHPPGYFRRLLKRRWWAFCVASSRAVLTRPSVAKRLFRAVFYRGDAPLDRPRSLLSSIAVAPEAQGTGIGRALVRRWMDEVQSRGSSGCFLTTDADANGDVQRFYRRLGWALEASYATPEGRRMNRYVFDFGEST